jgi:general secretion pathway protein B
MSSILKALKKLEDEKTSHSPESLKIDSDILKGSPEPRRMSPLSVLLACVLIFGGGAGAAYFTMKGNATRPAAVPPQAVTTVTPVIVPPPAVATPQPAKPAQPVAQPVAKAVAAPIQKKPVVAAVQKKPKPQKVAAVAAKHPASKPSKATAQRSSEKPLKIADQSTKNELPPSASMPALRVNGIAFQNNSADSMAIINGVPVSSGSTVEGATVEEIRRDRVVFQKSGEKFEIKLGQANK